MTTLCCCACPLAPPPFPRRSHSPQVRATCASALLQFLLDYPLGPKRTAAHLSFLATNLGFEHETGRLAVLDMLQQVCASICVWAAGGAGHAAAGARVQCWC